MPRGRDQGCGGGEAVVEPKLLNQRGAPSVDTECRDPVSSEASGLFVHTTTASPPPHP